MKRTAFLLILLILPFLAGDAGAMTSSNYNLDWLVPTTGGGGGPAGSSNYTANFTVGQTVVGASSSANYQVSLGYWPGAAPQSTVFLPVVSR